MLALVLLILTQTGEHIQALQPDLPEYRVRQVAKAVDAAALRYGLDPLQLVAIARVESNFRTGIRTCQIVHRYSSCQITCDYGIAQVNELWIRKWRLDPDRLQRDERYNLMVAARILRNLEQEFGDREPGNWIGRYNSGTPSIRAVYEQKLQPFLARR